MPLFWFGPGSEGEGPERYSIRIPCDLSADKSLDLPDDGVEAEGEKFRVRLLKEDPGFRVVAGPFPTAQAAEDAWPRVRAALLRAALEHRMGLRMPETLERPRVYDEPRPISDDSPVADLARKRGWDEYDGDYSANRPCVVPEHKRLMRFGTGAATAIKGLQPSAVASTIREGLQSPAVEKLASREKLQLAVELYTSAFFTSSQRAEVLRLVTVLEAVAEPPATPPAATDAWRTAVDRVESLLSELDEGGSERQAVERLLERMHSLRMGEESISQGIRALIAEAVDADPDLGQTEELQSKATKAYRVRSRLLHDGEAPDEDVAEAQDFLRSFVPQLLLSLTDNQKAVK